MKENRLIRMLKTFSREEWKEFEKFIASPYFNGGRNYMLLLKELKKFSPGFESAKLTKEYLYSKLQPGKPFKETVINSMASGVYSAAKEFLIHSDLKKDNARKSTVLLRELSLKGLKKEADLLINDFLKKYRSKKIGYNDYIERYLFCEEIYDHYFINDERKKLYSAIIQSNIYLVMYYLQMLIMAENQFLSTVNFSEENYKKSSLGRIIKLTEFEKIIAETEKYNSLESVLLKIYYYLLMANKNPENDSYYFEAKSLIQNNYQKLDIDLKNRCYVNLLGICTSKTMEGNIQWNKESFENYKVVLKDKLYYFTGDNLKFMPRRYFRNIVSVGISNNESEWTRDFINKYIGELEPRYRDTLFNYGMAKVEFKSKKYDKALHHINAVTQDQFIYKIEMKNLQAKIYYETNSTESLFSLLDTYHRMINNSGIMNTALIKRHESFIRYLKVLVRIKINVIDGNKLNALQNTIRNQKYLNSKPWLLEKVSELDSK